LFCYHIAQSLQTRSIEILEDARWRLGVNKILAIDLDTQTYKHSCPDWMMESIRSKLDPNVRITDQNPIAS
jgi:hypothetical protein